MPRNVSAVGLALIVCLSGSRTGLCQEGPPLPEPPPAAPRDIPLDPALQRMIEGADVSAPSPVQPLLDVPAPMTPPPKLWKGGLEFGVNGTEGNSKLFKVRLGGNAKRDAPGNLTKIDWLYSFANANEEETENRALLEARHEWLFDKSPWSVYATSNTYYDAFKAYDVRQGLFAGPSYQWWKTDVTELKSRLGVGGSWEFGGPDNNFMPEFNAGCDFAYKLSDRQKLSAVYDIYPNLTDPGDYWFQLKANYELLVDPTWNLTLKIGVLDRFDSTPDGKRPNDIEYFAVLLWNF